MLIDTFIVAGKYPVFATIHDAMYYFSGTRREKSKTDSVQGWIKYYKMQRYQNEWTWPTGDEFGTVVLGSRDDDSCWGSGNWRPCDGGWIRLIMLTKPAIAIYDVRADGNTVSFGWTPTATHDPNQPYPHLVKILINGKEFPITGKKYEFIRDDEVVK